MFPQAKILEAVAFFLVAVLALACIGYYGQTRYEAGVNAQKVADQKQFDAINAQLTQQKEQAAATLEAANAKVLSDETELLALRAQQGASYARDQAATEAQFVSTGSSALRVRVTCPTPQATGRGNGGGSALPAPAASAPAATAVAVELPSQTERDLRQLVFDADRLADAYRSCYRSWHPEWSEPAASAVVAANDP